MREAQVRATDLIDAREVLRGRDESDGNRPAKCGSSHLDQLDAITRRGEATEVGDRLFVVEQLVVGADGKAKRRFGSRQWLLGECRPRDGSAEGKSGERAKKGPGPNGLTHRRIGIDELGRREAAASSRPPCVTNATRGVVDVHIERAWWLT